MAKRAPDSLNSFRIELQEKERDLFEQWMYLDSLTKIINSLTSMSYGELYAWITILEALDMIDTPIPTIADKDEIPAALAAWAKNVKKGGNILSRIFDFYAERNFGLNLNPFDVQI